MSRPATETSRRPSERASGAASGTTAALARLRSEAYRAFSSLLLFPTDDRATALRDAAPVLSRAAVPFSEFVQFRTLESALARLDRLSPATAESLRDRYTILFLAGAGPASCPPYESWFTRRGGFDAGWIGATLDGVYAGTGLAGAPGQQPDHASVQLDFASVLCREEERCWERDEEDGAAEWLRKQRKFLAEHPARWLGLLARRLASVDPGGFYASAAESAATFVGHDLNLVDALLAWSWEERGTR